MHGLPTLAASAVPPATVGPAQRHNRPERTPATAVQDPPAENPGGSAHQVSSSRTPQGCSARSAGDCQCAESSGSLGSALFFAPSGPLAQRFKEKPQETSWREMPKELIGIPEIPSRPHASASLR